MIPQRADPQIDPVGLPRRFDGQMRPKRIFPKDELCGIPETRGGKSCINFQAAER